ncbi:flgN protein [bacterium BMS3Abin05]|nr:flgN protein [bacterium BMS3Abin05]GBE28864.1 flgN protein [bacterium BMS3Bbin03]HDZ11479.1 hypothetical protein [Bacteroidota bacterium]
MKTQTINPEISQGNRLFYNELFRALEKESGLLGELLKNYELQREALIKNDLQGFVKNLEEQQILVWEADASEKTRKALLENRFPERAIEDLTLTDILESAPDDIKRALREQQNRMKDLIRKVNLYRDTNRRLIQKSLEMLNYRIKLLTQWGERFYNQNGDSENEVPKLVNKQV